MSFPAGIGGQQQQTPGGRKTYSAAITNAVLGTGNQVKVTIPNHRFKDGNRVTVTGVVGTTEANGTWSVNVLTASTLILQGTTFANAYVSGGIATRIQT